MENVFADILFLKRKKKKKKKKPLFQFLCYNIFSINRNVPYISFFKQLKFKGKKKKIEKQTHDIPCSHAQLKKARKFLLLQGCLCISFVVSLQSDYQ